MSARLVRVEIAINGDRITAVSCTENVSPFRGHWRRFTFYDAGHGDRILHAHIIKGLRAVLRSPVVDSRKVKP